MLVLCYHSVSASWATALTVDPEALERQLAVLLRAGLRPVTFAEAARDGGRRGFAVTFDDGYRATYTVAFPILRRLGVPATVFVPTTYITSGERFAWPGVAQWLSTEHAHELEPLNWAQLGELREAGWEIGSHTRTHPHLPALDDRQIEEELKDSREEQAQHLGLPPSTIAYPYFDVDDRVARLAGSCGYVAGAAGWGRKGRELLRLPRVPVYRKDSLGRFLVKVSPVGPRLGTG